MAIIAVRAEILIWGYQVGAVVEMDDGRVIFEYDKGWQQRGIDLSPVMLPVSTLGPQEFPELRRIEAFEGLPGLLADALPDRFGNAIIRRYFESLGTPAMAMSPVQKLLYVSDRAMGALTFRPAKQKRLRKEDEAIEIAALVDQARRVIEGQTDDAIQEIMQVGGSAGGARPKAIIRWNRQKNQVRSAFASPQLGDEHWLIKFDGVGELDAPDPEPKPYNRVEYAYGLMAKKAKIDMSDIHLHEERRLAHFMTRRFDREGEERVHMASLGGLRHVDYQLPGAFSYEEYLRTILFLGLGAGAVEQGFRRAVFNILARNQDDHVKNFGFLMDKKGRWHLAPAYDLTYANGRNYTRQHQMSLNGKFTNFTLEDLLAVGKKFSIKKSGMHIIEEVDAAIDQWPELAADAGVPMDRMSAILQQHRRLLSPG